MADDELAKFLAGAKVQLAEAVTKAVNRAAIGLRDQVRGQVQSHFKGDKLVKAVRSRTYPQGRRSSVSAAGLVYIAADWIEAHIQGATISAKEGYMAIPLPEAEARGYDRAGVDRSSFGRFSKGSGAGDAMIAAAIRDFGRLAFIPSPGGGVLVAKTRGKTIPLFALRRQVQLKKSIDVAGPAADWLNRLGDDIAAGLGD